MKQVLFFVPFALVCACSNAKSYDIQGEIKGAATIRGPIALEVLQLDTVDGKTTRTQVFEGKVDKIGSFAEKVDLSPGSKAIVRAIVDEDGDGKCTAGELWAEQQIDKLDDQKANVVTLNLAATACPVDDAAASK